MNKLKCPHCSYVAKYRRTLKRHLLIHTGVRSFSCDICGKLFTRREHVKRHSLVSDLKLSANDGDKGFYASDVSSILFANLKRYGGVALNRIIFELILYFI